MLRLRLVLQFLSRRLEKIFSAADLSEDRAKGSLKIFCQGQCAVCRH